MSFYHTDIDLFGSSIRALGEDLSTAILGEVLRATYSFPNVRRAPAQSGVLKRYKTDISKTSNWLYLDGEQKLSPWATSMVLQVCVDWILLCDWFG